MFICTIEWVQFLEHSVYINFNFRNCKIYALIRVFLFYINSELCTVGNKKNEPVNISKCEILRSAHARNVWKGLILDYYEME